MIRELPKKKNYLLPWIIHALLLLAIGSFIAYSLYEEHERIGKQEEERLAAQAVVIEKNLAGELAGVCLALKGIRNDLPYRRGSEGMARVNRQLTVLCDAMPGIRTILVTDSGGTIIAANRPEVIGQDISYREYFQAPLKGRNPSTLYISPPFTTLLGSFVIPATLMLSGPRGEFAGIVSASLDPAYFKTLLGSVLSTSDMWAALAHGDGKQFLMMPDQPGIDPAKQNSIFSRRANGKPATVFTGGTYTTGKEWMVAIRTIKPANVPMDKPLVAAVGRKLSATYADWSSRIWEKAGMFILLAVIMTVALFLNQRRQKHFATLSLKTVEEALLAKEAKSRFLATVAHEFRTPLSLLTSSVDILDRYGERLSPSERTGQHDHIRNAAGQMSSLVDSVLSFNRLEGHASHAVPLGITPFCRHLAGEMATIHGSDYEFSVAIADDCGSAMLNEALLRRVMLNLLTNAFRYTPVGGTISLSVMRDKDLLQVVVEDSGIGIPEEDRQRIFETFYRCSNVAGRRGLGLGLYIVHEALSRLGGTITVESSVGSGTTMRVSIPLSTHADI